MSWLVCVDGVAAQAVALNKYPTRPSRRWTTALHKVCSFFSLPPYPFVCIRAEEHVAQWFEDATAEAMAELVRKATR